VTNFSFPAGTSFVKSFWFYHFEYLSTNWKVVWARQNDQWMIFNNGCCTGKNVSSKSHKKQILKSMPVHNSSFLSRIRWPYFKKSWKVNDSAQFYPEENMYHQMLTLSIFGLSKTGKKRIFMCTESWLSNWWFFVLREFFLRAAFFFKKDRYISGQCHEVSKRH